MVTPCDTCKPVLKECNIPYVTLYLYCQDQYIMGFSGPIALNMLAVNQAMIDYRVPENERRAFSTTVRRIANIVIRARADEAEEERKKK